MDVRRRAGGAGRGGGCGGRGPGVRLVLVIGQARRHLRPVRGAGPLESAYPDDLHRARHPVTSFRRPRGATSDESRARPGPGRADLRRRRAMRPTCQQLPPNFPGYEPYCPYTSEPGPEGKGYGPPRTSRRSSGRPAFGHERDARRVRIPPEYWPRGPPWGIHDRSARQGRVPREREARRRIEFYGSGNEFQMALSGWGADYPGGVELHRPVTRAAHP